MYPNLKTLVGGHRLTAYDGFYLSFCYYWIGTVTFHALFSADCVLFLQEAERELQQKWNPVVEINYRGGIYKGRCQGGLPEGKVLCYSSGT